MEDKTRMPKVDVVSDTKKLSPAQLDYMRILEQQNLERVAKLKQLKRKNLITGLSLAAIVVGIYTYSIVAVKQEKFLDEVDEKN